MTDTTETPRALLSGCNTMHQLTITYPLADVPDLERGGKRRPIRPREIKIYARRENNGPWYLTSPLVIGREVCKGGRLGLADRAHSVVFESEHPQWLTDVVASIRAALDGQR